jgi:hypothetical protein
VAIGESIPRPARCAAAINDLGLAVTGALLLFVLPSGDRARRGALLDWACAERIPWGIALVFGAGLPMVAAMQGTGVTRWLGQNLDCLDRYEPQVILLMLVSLMIFLAEVSAHTATLTAMLPVIAALADVLGATADHGHRRSDGRELRLHAAHLHPAECDRQRRRACTDHAHGAHRAVAQPGRHRGDRDRGAPAGAAAARVTRGCDFAMAWRDGACLR